MKHIKLAALVFLFLVACAPTQTTTLQVAVITKTVTATPQIVTVTAVPTDTPTKIPTNTATPTNTPTRTPIPTNTPLPLIAVSFYRVRIEYSTTADWTTLDIDDSDNILTVQLMAINGVPSNVQATPRHLSLNQPLDAAKAGQSVGLTMDFALSLKAVNQPLQFLLQKGAINGSVVRVYNVSGNDAQLIQEITHQVVVRNNTDLNPLTFSVDLATLKNIQPRQARIQRVAPQRMLWAFYYPWYHLSDWSSLQLKDRPSTPYTSNSSSAIARQIDQAQGAGIDGFISSWWGPGSYTDQNLELLLDLAKDRNFKVAIYFETLTDSGPRNVDEISRWLAYAISTYRDHPAFMKVNGKPLIVVWASGSVPLASWKTIFANLRQQGLDAVYLAMGYNATNLDVFDGLHEYGVFTLPHVR